MNGDQKISLPIERSVENSLRPEELRRVQRRVREWVDGGISGNKLAKLVGLSQPMINKIMMGRSCSRGSAAMLADYDGVTLEEFVGPVPDALDGLLKNKPLRTQWLEEAIVAILQSLRRMSVEERNSHDSAFWVQRLFEASTVLRPIVAMIRPPPPPAKPLPRKR